MQNKKAKDWFIRGQRDIEDASRLLDSGGHTTTIAILIQQGVEKYLKGYLLSQGWKLKKTHDIEELITYANKYDKDFAEYLDFARIITAYYVEDRYPPSDIEEYPIKETIENLKKAQELIKK